MSSGVSEQAAGFDVSGAARDAVGALPSSEWTPHRPDRRWEKLEGGIALEVDAPQINQRYSKLETIIIIAIIDGPDGAEVDPKAAAIALKVEAFGIG